MATTHASTAAAALAAEHRAARIDLAAAFRWFARLNMHESVANHLSVAVSADGAQFLINPRGRHFARMSAGDLLLLDANDPATLDRPDAPDPTAWHLHARLHARIPAARCVMHLHPKYATALACLQDPTMYPIDMNTMRFFGRVALDDGFSGMALSDNEGDRVAGLMSGGQSVLLMANHGVLVIGATVAAAGAAGAAAEPAGWRAVRFSGVGWRDIPPPTALASRLLQALGYRTVTQILSIPFTYASIKNRKIDFYLGDWQPSMEEDRKP